MVTLESLENPFIIPLLMNCKKDNPELISSRMPYAIQKSGTFIIDLDSLGNRKDVFCDDNGAWTMKGNREKLYCVTKNFEGQVSLLYKVSSEADISVRRRPYICKSCPEFHKIIVTIEYGKSIDKWFSLALVHYYWEGKPRKFKVAPHGNRKPESSAPPYVKTKESTKQRLVQNLTGEKTNPKRALFKTIKDSGGVCGAESVSSLPRNVRQVKQVKHQLGLTSSSAAKGNNDPLMAVLELQKGCYSGFIREVTCNDLPTVMLFTDQQVDDIVRFCCHKKPNLVSELGMDITFQLGPFYLLVTTYKNPMLTVKGTSHPPSLLGPVMVCMTKEESTYLSFLHCLLRAVPGLGNFLHATGTDNESALRNAIAAGCPQSHPLLCYLHSKKNVKEKLRRLGLSQALSGRIIEDIYAKGTGLLWSNSKKEFDARVAHLMQDWHRLEASERKVPEFVEYFCKCKLEDMRERMAKYVVHELGLGEEPYLQNISEAMNSMLKEWNNFIPQELDRFVLSLYDFQESQNMETELAWFGLSDKWEVSDAFKQHMPRQEYGEMTVEERKNVMKQISKLCPDPHAYKQCKNFKFTPSSSSSSSSTSSTHHPSRSVDLGQLEGQFSSEELSSLSEKAKALIHNKGLREGFQMGSFLVDSGASLPCKVQLLKSGKCSCSCSFFSRNNICHHCVAVAIHTERVEQIVASFPGRSLTRVSTSSAPKSVGTKVPPRKRPREQAALPPQATVDKERSHQFTAEAIGDTTVVIRKSAKPNDPPPSAPLVIKSISGGIRMCAGCKKPLSTIIEGYSEDDDKTYCFGRFEAYNFWNKSTQRYQATTSTRHYHLNPVCTKVWQSESPLQISAGNVQISEQLRTIINERFSYNLI